jgi:hypothetical protein
VCTAADMLGLSTSLLDAAKTGTMRRGREEHRLDLSYPDSALTLEIPERTVGIRAGDRAPDAVTQGAAGQSIRLFDLFKGPHWTLLGYDMARSAIGASRPDLHIHAIGPHGDIDDVHGSIREGYGVAGGDLILVRPDGYVGAIVSVEQRNIVESYKASVGLIGGAFGGLVNRYNDSRW